MSSYQTVSPAIERPARAPPLRAFAQCSTRSQWPRRGLNEVATAPAAEAPAGPGGPAVGGVPPGVGARPVAEAGVERVRHVAGGVDVVGARAEGGIRHD